MIVCSEMDMKPTPRRGRPPLRGVARMTHLSMRIGDDELGNLKKHARDAKLGVSPFIMNILEAAGYLAPPKRKRAP